MAVYNKTERTESLIEEIENIKIATNATLSFVETLHTHDFRDVEKYLEHVKRELKMYQGYQQKLITKLKNELLKQEGQQ